ncbi:hypothetical protein [Thiomonas sp.]
MATSTTGYKKATLNRVENFECAEYATAPPGSAENPLHPLAAHDDAGDASYPAQFLDWAQNVLPQTDLRAAITAAWNRPEPECLPMLIELAQIPDATQRAAVRQLAGRLVEGVRARREMGAGEALLRIPDNATRDALMRDKTGAATGSPISATRPRCLSTPPSGC